MKTVYFFDKDSLKLIGATILNDDVAQEENMTTLVPPEHEHELEIPVWDNGQWKIELTEKGSEIAEKKTRNERNMLLTQTDWTQLPDSPLSEEVKAAVQEYRQQLRDLPASITDLRTFEWPANPLDA